MSEPILLSKETKAMLKDVIKLMEQNLARIDMRTWIHNQPKSKGVPAEECGTTGCAAGYICMNAGYSGKFLYGLPFGQFADVRLPTRATKPTVPVVADPERDVADTGDLARALMGIHPVHKMDFLFMWMEWPQPYRDGYLELIDEWGEIIPKNRKKAGKVVVKRLRHFIKTGL